MESYFSRYFLLICIIGGSTASKTSPDDFPKHHIVRKTGVEETENGISWSSQSPTIDLATKDVDIKKVPAESPKKIEPKSFDGTSTVGLHADEIKNTMHPTGQPKFVPRRETSSHLHRKRGDNSSSDSSSSSSSEDAEDKPKKKDSHKRRRHDNKYYSYPSPSFYRGTQLPNEKRFQRHLPQHNNGYGQKPYHNRYDAYPHAQYPGEYDQYGLHVAGSRKRHSGGEYPKYHQKPYPMPHHDHHAAMNIPLSAQPLLAH